MSSGRSRRESMRSWNHRCSALPLKKCKRRQLSCTLRPEGMNRVPPIDSVEHVGELGSRDSNNAGGRRWPDEEPLLKPLGIERHADAVMPKHLDQVASHAP